MSEIKDLNDKLDFFENGQLAGSFLIKENKFDWDIFKKRIFRIEIKELPCGSALQRLIFALKEKGADFILTEADKNDAAVIKELSSAGFSEICSNVLMERAGISKLKTLNSRPDLNSFIMRKAEKKDLSKIKEIARKTHTPSHFFMNKEFEDKAPMLYEKWAENDFFKGNLFVAAEKDIPVGFVSYSQKTEKNKLTATIGLVRISKEHQGKGIGSALFSYTIKNLGGADKLYVGASSSNTPAIKIYEKNGFKVIRESIVFHKKL